MGTEWNIVELSEEQREEHAEFLRMRRALREGHGQRLGAVTQEQRTAMRRDARRCSRTEQPRSRGYGRGW
eukprot:582843-Lingulodinium_polyedra.AAC.1